VCTCEVVNRNRLTDTWFPLGRVAFPGANMEYAARIVLTVSIVAATAFVVFLVGAPLFVPAGALAALDRRR
jgi:hypothetical protein